MENKEIENRQLLNPNQQDNWPETLKNPIYTPAFLREQIGKLMRVEFLIGTNNLVDRIGVLEDVGASYILLRSFENDSLVYCDIYAIKFITISTTGIYANYLQMSKYKEIRIINSRNNLYFNMLFKIYKRGMNEKFYW
ncbi:MAG: hypothetical protein ACLU2J_04925 [Clostridia bacterium]